MENKIFDRRKNVLAILLLLCFALSMTVASASAADNSNGYNDGYKKGYDDGKIQSEKDCQQYGSRENLSKVPSPLNDDSWTESYKNRYNDGYKNGYLDGYNGNRYSCLR